MKWSTLTEYIRTQKKAVIMKYSLRLIFSVLRFNHTKINVKMKTKISETNLQRFRFEFVFASRACIEIKREQRSEFLDP